MLNEHRYLDLHKNGPFEWFARLPNARINYVILSKHLITIPIDIYGTFKARDLSLIVSIFLVLTRVST